jgi:hypothetical protein
MASFNRKDTMRQIARTAFALTTAGATLLAVDVGAAARGADSLVVRPAATTAVSQALVGQWSRRVTEADRRRIGGTLPTGIWRMTIARTGAMTLRGPRFSFRGRAVPLKAADRIQLSIATRAPNVYRWRVSTSGGLLTLVRVTDPVDDRATILIGGWRRG